LSPISSVSSIDPDGMKKGWITKVFSSSASVTAMTNRIVVSRRNRHGRPKLSS
jgi:hypothetical protein